MDLSKFCSLSDNSALFFSSPAYLGDSFEGSYTAADLAENRVYNETRKQFEEIEPEKMAEARRMIFLLNRQSAFVNCWHMNEVEPAAMWAAYAHHGSGIAIQSTFDRLRRSFDAARAQDVFIGEVDYLDYDRDIVPGGTMWSPLLCKRQSFAHERELRAMVVDYTSVLKGDKIVVGGENPVPGVSVPVALTVLLERVYVAPTSPKWFRELVERMMGRFGLEGIEVVNSGMNARPMY
jgi:hypothetical protein